jgi:hypothetical protein
MARIILDSIRIAPKILRYAKRFGDEAANKLFSPSRVRAAKDSVDPDRYRGGSNSMDRVQGIDKRTVNQQYEKLFDETPTGSLAHNRARVIKKLEEAGEKVLYKSKGGITNMTKDKTYYRGII